MNSILKNKRGNIFFSIVIAIMVFIIGMVVVTFIKAETTSTYTSLSCSNEAAITDGTKALCLIMDGVIPYYFVLICSIVIGVITEKLLI